MHVEHIVVRHWKSYGRNYYSRYDYEGVDVARASAVLAHLRGQFDSLPGTVIGDFQV